MFEPLKGGPTDGISVDRKSHEKAKKFYYEIAGWDEETGNPTDATMRKLSLHWLLEQQEAN